MSKVTMRIIAEKSGMSKYAVSRALAGKDGVSDASRARILEIAEQLGYQRAAPPEVPEVVVIFDDRDHINAELHAQILTGLQREAARLRYVVRAHWLHHEAPVEQTLARAAGVLAINLADPATQLMIRSLRKRVVHLGWTEPLEPVDIVGGADHEAGEKVGRYLIDLGHREIVYAHGPIDLRGRRERFYGIREVVERAPGVTLHDVIWREDETFSDSFAALLDRGVRPTAFFCAHDGLALSVVTDVLSRGWRIPEDVTVIGFGDFNAARQIRPALTTIRFPGPEIGRALMHLLHLRIADTDWPEVPMRIRLANELIERNSSGRAPASHPLDR